MSAYHTWCGPVAAAAFLGVTPREAARRLKAAHDPGDFNGRATTLEAIERVLGGSWYDPPPAYGEATVSRWLKTGGRKYTGLVACGRGRELHVLFVADGQVVADTLPWYRTSRHKLAGMLPGRKT